MKQIEATEILLYEPYVSKNIIRIHFACSDDKATEIFKLCKEQELSQMPIDPRPHRVMSRTVFKVMKLDYNFTLKQFKSNREREETK